MIEQEMESKKKLFENLAEFVKNIPSINSLDCDFTDINLERAISYFMGSYEIATFKDMRAGLNELASLENRLIAEVREIMNPKPFNDEERIIDILARLYRKKNKIPEDKEIDIPEKDFKQILQKLKRRVNRLKEAKINYDLALDKTIEIIKLRLNIFYQMKKYFEYVTKDTIGESRFLFNGSLDPARPHYDFFESSGLSPEQLIANTLNALKVYYTRFIKEYTNLKERVPSLDSSFPNLEKPNIKLLIAK